MVTKSDCTDATATADTVKTTCGTITLPGGSVRPLYVGCYAVGGAGFTTLENVTGVFEVESKQHGALGKWPLDCVAVLVSGVIAFSPRLYPVEWPNLSNDILTFYVTLDNATAIHNKARGILVFDHSP